jgi:DNA-binding transcriptional regulator YiaG
VSTRFRHVDFDQAEPLDRWPAEAIETIMDRGSLSDWSRLAEAIRRSPWGPAARTAEQVAQWGEHYGVDALIARVVDGAREQLTQRGREEYAEQIRSWRAQTGMTMRQFAAVAGTSASRLSDYENARVAPTTDVLARLRAVANSERQPKAARPLRAGTRG